MSTITLPTGTDITTRIRINELAAAAESAANRAATLDLVRHRATAEHRAALDLCTCTGYTDRDCPCGVDAAWVVRLNAEVAHANAKFAAQEVATRLAMATLSAEAVAV